MQQISTDVDDEYIQEDLTCAVLRRIAQLADLNVCSYSGRGMYGRRCPAIDVDNLMDGLASIVECSTSPGQAADIIRSMNYDRMGLGYVLYWPGCFWED